MTRNFMKLDVLLDQYKPPKSPDFLPKIFVEGLKFCYHCVWGGAIKTPDSKMFSFLQSFLDCKNYWYCLQKQILIRVKKPCNKWRPVWVHTARFSFEPGWTKGLVEHLWSHFGKGFFQDDLLVLSREHLDEGFEGGVPKLGLADRSHVFPNTFTPLPIFNLNLINTFWGF